MQAAWAEVEETLQVLRPVLATQPTWALANASVFLEACGHTVLAWVWLEQALVAARALPTAQGSDVAFYQGTLHTCQWFYRWELPRTRAQHDLLRSLDDTTLTASPDWF